LQTDARATVRDIARHIGLSQRRFIQVFTEEIGMTPKLFSRVQRFQRTIALVRQTTAPDWARLAVDCGYFDQSHLIRDFLMFSGFSPADYLRRQNYLRQHGVHIKRNHFPLPE
jgi:transcriptional regulator GlxA family with amidase domain